MGVRAVDGREQKAGLCCLCITWAVVWFHGVSGTTSTCRHHHVLVPAMQNIFKQTRTELSGSLTVCFVPALVRSRLRPLARHSAQLNCMYSLLILGSFPCVHSIFLPQRPGCGVTRWRLCVGCAARWGWRVGPRLRRLTTCSHTWCRPVRVQLCMW